MKSLLRFSSISSVTFNYTWLMNHQLNSAGVNNQLFQYVPQAGTVSYGTADVDNALTTETANSGSASFTYDGNHNLTYDGYNTLSYDVENRLIAAENAAWGTSTYLYDPLDERKQKVVGADTAMPVATDFVLAGGEEIADYYETSATWRLTVRGAGGLPLAAVVPAAGGGSEEIVYVHHDRKGSTVARTVPGGTGPSDTYTYSDYGAPQSGSWLAYRYAGYRYDSETGLYYMPARSYSPTLGRFMQADPSGFGGGLNLYAYAGNDPVNQEDSTGLSPDGGGITITLSLSIASPFMAVLGVPQITISATSCSCLSLDNQATFYDATAATPAQVQAFLSSYPGVPATWDGAEAARAFSAADINPGLAVGILGAETSLAPSNSRNVTDPFSSGGSEFHSSMMQGLRVIAKIESASYTYNHPLANLTNGNNSLRGRGRSGQQYDTTQTAQWTKNVNSFYRKFIQFIGGCR